MLTGLEKTHDPAFALLHRRFHHGQNGGGWGNNVFCTIHSEFLPPGPMTRRLLKQEDIS